MFCTYALNYDCHADTSGESERIVGRWLAKQTQDVRDELVVATKLTLPQGPTPNLRGAGRKWVNAAVNRSLERLGLETIDLMYLHTVDESVDVDRVVMTFRNLIASGKVTHWGLSNFAGYQIMKLLCACDRLGCPRPVCVQAQYSLLCRSTEWEVAKVCKTEGLGLVPWSPLGSGLLSGKYSRPSVEVEKKASARGADASGAAKDEGTEGGRLHVMKALGVEHSNFTSLNRLHAEHYAWDVVN